MDKLRPPDSGDAPIAKAQSPLALILAAGGRETIALEALAAKRGFRTATGTWDGEHVVRPAGEPPALLFLDVNGASQERLRGLARIRDQLPGVPIVAISSRSDPEAVDRMLRRGALNVIHKPLDPEEADFVLERLYESLGEDAAVWDAIDVVAARATELSFESRPHVVPKVVDYLGRELQIQYPAAEIPITDIKLALYEAFANALEHGNLGITYEEKSEAMTAPGGVRAVIDERLKDPALAARRIYVRVEYAPEQVEYAVRDEGEGFDHISHTERPMAHSTALHGRGLKLIEHYMDDVHWNEIGSEIVMRKSIGGE